MGLWFQGQTLDFQKITNLVSNFPANSPHIFAATQASIGYLKMFTSVNRIPDQIVEIEKFTRPLSRGTVKVFVLRGPEMLGEILAFGAVGEKGSEDVRNGSKQQNDFCSFE